MEISIWSSENPADIQNFQKPPEDISGEQEKLSMNVLKWRFELIMRKHEKGILKDAF